MPVVERNVYKLTDKLIRSFKYEGGWDVRWDDSVPGFGLRIYPTGKKAFVLHYRPQGSQNKRLMVLGRFGADLTVKQARETAAKHRAQIRDGVDPLQEKQRVAAAKTFGELANQFIEEYAKVHKKTWETDEGRLERHIPQSWRRRKVASITREDVESLHRSIGETRPYEANRTLDLLRVVFRQARLWPSIEFVGENPAEGIRKFPEQQRRRWVTPEEFPYLASAIDEESSIYVRSALWLYMLVGLRKTELLKAKREDIDWDRKRLRLPDTKSGEEQWMPLSSPAIAILEAIPAMVKNPYILPGSKAGQHLVNIEKPWRRVRKAATVAAWASDKSSPTHKVIKDLKKGTEDDPSYDEVAAEAEGRGIELPTGLVDVRLHDLRRTVGSWLSGSNVDLNKVRETLRHRNIATTLVYARLSQDSVREVMEEHGRRVMEVAGKGIPTPVEVAHGRE
tara:strand:+ start:190 stop:1542 length:1353 start_codon:yes stop_codon:yes gene_type:complete